MSKPVLNPMNSPTMEEATRRMVHGDWPWPYIDKLPMKRRHPEDDMRIGHLTRPFNENEPIFLVESNGSIHTFTDVDDLLKKFWVVD